MINGLAYGDGDLVSVSHNGRRFTWRVKGLTNKDTIKLVRVRARTIEDNDAKHSLNVNNKEKNK